MPIKYSVSSDGMFVYVTATEPLTTEHVIEYQKDVWKDDRVKPGYGLLFDESRISESRIDENDLRIIAAREESDQAKPPSKLAIVAGPGKAFPRALEFERMVSPETETVIVFHNIDIAKKWLGIHSM